MLFEEGRKAFKHDNTILALEKLKQFVKLNPSSTLTDDALFIVGQIYLKRDNPYEALKYFQKIERDFPGSNTFVMALYGEAYCWYRLKDLERSGEALDRLFVYVPLPDSLYVRAETLKGHLCILKKKVRCGIQAYLQARTRTNNSTTLSVLDSFIEKVIFDIQNPKLLREVMDSHPEDIAGDASRVRLAEVLTQRKDFKDAKKLLPPTFVMNLPETLRHKAREILAMLKRAFIRKLTIGCLLPLSGPRAPFGLRALKGILLATRAFDLTPTDLDITLLIKDTKGHPKTASKMAKELIESSHVQAIVGPMFMDTTKAAVEQLHDIHVPLISLSQADGIPELGPYVFRNCLTPEQQVQTLVRFITQALNFHTAAILYPKNPFGMKYMRLFWETFEKAGGEIRGAESYHPTDTDFGTQIKKLVGIYYTKERWGRGDTPNSEGKFSPVIDFKVLFIPDVYNRVVLIAPQLAFYDVVGITPAGINTWNDPKLIKEGGRYVKGAVFTDGFFPGSNVPAIKRFVKAFRATFNETPEILAAQAYDATRFFIRAFKQTPGDDMEKLKNTLERDSGYHGVSGLRYFDENGEAIRDVLILTVTHNRIVPFPLVTPPSLSIP